MSKIFKKIGSGAKKIFSGSNLGTDQFKAEKRKINRGAFDIKDADKFAKRAKTDEESSRQRSETAQKDRRGLIEDLQKQAKGEGPSLAEAQLKSASDRNLAQQLAAAQSQRGGNVAAQQRQLMQSQAQAGQQVAQDAVAGRLQERESAQQQLGQQVSQEQQLSDQLTQNYLAQGFNIEQAQQQAAADFEKIETDQFMAAQGANLSGFQSAAKARAGLFSGLSGGIAGAAAASDKRAKTKIKKAGSKDVSKEMLKSMSSEETKKGIEKVEINKKEPGEKKKSKFGKFLKGSSSTGTKKTGEVVGYAIGSAIKKAASKDEKKSKGPDPKVEAEKKKTEAADEAAAAKKKQQAQMVKAAVMLSDEKSKKNVEAYSDKNIKKDFLDKLQAYTYEYKNEYKDHPKAGKGRYMSVMAQDLEKAGPIGESMVKEDESGTKIVDYGKGYGAILAAQTHLNKRLDELEKKSTKKRK